MRPKDLENIVNEEIIDFEKFYNNLHNDLMLTVERLSNLSPIDLKNEKKRYRLMQSLNHLHEYFDQLEEYEE